MAGNIFGAMIDLINMVRLQDTADMSRVNNDRYEQDQRAQYLKSTYGLNVPNFYEFNRQTQSDEKPAGPLARIGKWMFSGAIVTGLVFGGLLLFGAVPAANLGVLALAAAASTALIGVVGGLVDDEKPQMDLKQMGKYKDYLDSLEKDIEQAKGQGLIKEPAQTIEAAKAKGAKSFVELVSDSRTQPEQAAAAGRA